MVLLTPTSHKLVGILCGDINDFNSSQFKMRMKKTAALVHLDLNLSAFGSPELFGAWKLAHICPVMPNLLIDGWSCLRNLSAYSG